MQRISCSFSGACVDQVCSGSPLLMDSFGLRDVAHIRVPSYSAKESNGQTNDALWHGVTE